MSNILLLALTYTYGKFYEMLSINQDELIIIIFSDP